MVLMCLIMGYVVYCLVLMYLIINMSLIRELN